MVISLLQWNVWLDEPIDNVIEELRRLDADIVCLQELTTRDSDPAQDRPRLVAEALGFHAHFVAAHSWPDDTGSLLTMGNAVMSRYPLSSTRSAVIRAAHGGAGAPERGRAYAEAAVQLPSGPLTVGTTHLSYIHRFTDTAHKQEEVERLIVEVGPSPSRRVLTGDLNVTPDSASFRRLTGIMTAAGPDGGLPTWTTKPYQDGDFVATSLGWRLDHVLVSPDVIVESAEIVDTVVSDHLPVLVRLNV